MLHEVTQRNVHLLIPRKIGYLACRLMRDKGIDARTALLKVYHSPIYPLLEKESTKLWQESPAQLYEEHCYRRLRKPAVKKPARHSRLEPFADTIMAWRHRGFAIRTIAAELARQGCSCTYQNVWHFIRKQLGY